VSYTLRRSDGGAFALYDFDMYSAGALVGFLGLTVDGEDV
jgi:hypothetical protein